jgi:predicted ArsR family transcriptional regulator
MTLTLIKDIARPHVLDIIMLLKRGRGMSVNELSAALRMSYMGVKQHSSTSKRKATSAPGCGRRQLADALRRCID